VARDGIHSPEVYYVDREFGSCGVCINYQTARRLFFFLLLQLPVPVFGDHQRLFELFLPAMSQPHFLFLAKGNCFNEGLVDFVFKEVQTKVGILFVKASRIQITLVEEL